MRAPAIRKKMRRSRGFATFTAVTLVGLLGVALASLTLALASQSHRTGEEAADAQLRQLLLVGSVQAKAMIDHGDAKAGDVRTIPLPRTLTDGGAKLELHFIQNPPAVEAEIQASFGGRTTVWEKP
jgi:hypothetical protein